MSAAPSKPEPATVITDHWAQLGRVIAGSLYEWQREGRDMPPEFWDAMRVLEGAWVDACNAADGTDFIC